MLIGERLVGMAPRQEKLRGNAVPKASLEPGSIHFG